jgi:hypothetical protein
MPPTDEIDDIEGIVQLSAIEARLDELRPNYLSATPYPHAVIDDVLPPDVLQRVYDELAAMPSENWNSYLHYNERKYSNTDTHTWGPTVRAVSEVFSSQRFVDFLGELTGIDGLLPDPSLDGGGLHRSYRRGFLNVHTDFTAHHKIPTWRRRINLLLYLNPQWQQDWGGELELWDSKMTKCEATVAPLGNRMLLFTTDETSFHGHPEPLQFPEGTARQSLALYYFTEEANPLSQATNYQPRPEDGFRRIWIYLDAKALAVYDKVKRRFKLSDAAINRVLRPFSRKQK